MPRPRKRWLREFGLYAALFGLPLLAFFPYFPWRPDAGFRASLHSKAVQFTVGDYEGRGLFSGVPANVTVENFDQAEIPGAGVVRSSSITFTNSELYSLLLVKGADVTMEWDEANPSGVHLIVHYQSKPPAVPLQVFLNDDSAIRCEACDPVKPSVGIAKLYAKENGLSIGVDPLSLDEKSVAALPAQVLPTLASGSAIRFRTHKNENAILGFDNRIELSNGEGPEHVFQEQDLQIGALRVVRGTQLSIKNGLQLEIYGQAGRLTIGGRDVRPSLVEVLRAQKGLSAWLTTTVLIGTAGLTILSRLKLIRMENKVK